MSESVHADVVVGTEAGGPPIAGEALRAGRSAALIEAGTPTSGRPGCHMRDDKGEENRLDAILDRASERAGVAA